MGLNRLLPGARDEDVALAVTPCGRFHQACNELHEVLRTLYSTVRCSDG